jgi:hypothetical protein
VNACLRFNAPGIGGPPDAPEYKGPSVADITAQKLCDAGFVQMFAADVPADVFALLIAGDDFTFAHRFRHEMERLAGEAALEEFDHEREKFFAECAR